MGRSGSPSAPSCTGLPQGGRGRLCVLSAPERDYDGHRGEAGGHMKVDEEQRMGAAKAVRLEAHDGQAGRPGDSPGRRWNGNQC